MIEQKRNNLSPKLFGLKISSLARDWTILLFFGLCQTIAAQTLKPHGAFLSDSVKIGLPVQYTLSLRHPPEIQVVFPDSGYRFGPFEWMGKRYFPTRTDARGSMDSVVYTFTTFNIESVQRLRLPVFIARQRDCTAVYTDTDSLLVRQLISRSPKFMVPRTNIDYVPVLQTLDYQFVLLVGGGSVLFVLLLYALFGRRIKRQYRLYRLWRGHRGFVSNYERLRRRVRTQKEPAAVENTVILWKRYMEGLHEKPYTSYTTKEITEVIDRPNLAESLQTADRAIYGNTMPDEIYGALRTLQAIAEHFYKRRRTEVRSG